MICNTTRARDLEFRQQLLEQIEISLRHYKKFPTKDLLQDIRELGMLSESIKNKYYGN